MNKSNQLIFQDCNSVQIWELQNSYQWCFHSYITIFQVSNENPAYYELDYSQDESCKQAYIYNALNENEDLLVIANHSLKLQFWIRSENSWTFFQAMECSKKVTKIQFNQSCNMILANIFDSLEATTLIFHKDKISGEWKIIKSIKAESNCFLDNDSTIAYYSDSAKLIKICRVCEITQDIIIQQELKVYHKNNLIQSSIKELNYMKYKDALIVSGKDFFYIIKKSNEIYQIQQLFLLQYHPVQIYNILKERCQLLNPYQLLNPFQRIKNRNFKIQLRIFYEY